MKKIVVTFIFIISFALISCGADDERGIDIGDTTVAVSFKETTDMAQNIIDTAKGMYVVFDSIARTMQYYDVPYSNDSSFMWRVITMMLNYSDEATISDTSVQATAELVGDYVSASFSGASIPQINDTIAYNPESMIYTVPKLTDYAYGNYIIEVGDILDNNDGTYTAYINCIVNTEDSIGEQYIFTLKKNPRTSAASNYTMIYSVTLAAVLEL